MQPRQFTLDILRGVAILAVLAFHLRVATGSAAVDRWLRPFVDLGWVGVDLFFVLSGFLVGRLILVEAAAPGGFVRARFFARRILRLWPVLYLYLAALVVIGGAGGWRMAVPVMLHVQNYARDVPSHLWSLAVEEHFYLAAAFALPMLARRRLGVPIALAVLLIGCLVLRIGAQAAGVAPVDLQWQTQYRADALAAGVMLAWLDLHRPAVIAWCLARRGTMLAIAAAGFGWLATVADPEVRFGAGLTIAWMASAALLLAAHRAQVPVRLHAPARALAWLGGIAYPLYVWHVSLGRIADGLAPLCGIGDGLPLLAWRYGLAILGAAAIAALVERPFMRLRDRAPTRAGKPLAA